MATTPPSPPAEPAVESRPGLSTCGVPLRERHGKVSDMGPLWFMSNAQIATLAVGLISITTGGDLLWSLVAIVLGILLGTFFMAAHSAQGPQLGLPQMIQSRPQFGYVGALLVWFFAFVQYAGFNVFNTVLAGEATSQGVHMGSPKTWFWLITIIGALIAVFGYNLIHKFERYLTYATILALAFLTIAALTKLSVPGGAWDVGNFHIVPFLGQLGVAAGYQIFLGHLSYRDYSRYLPPTHCAADTSSTFWAVPWADLDMALAPIASAVGDSFDTVGSLGSTADKLLGGSGNVVLIVFALGLVSVIALNMYGGSLTLISSIDSLKRVRPTVTLRVVTVGITAALSLVFDIRCLRALPDQFQQLPAARPVLLHSVDSGTSPTISSFAAGITPSRRSSTRTGSTGGGDGPASRPTSSDSSA